MPRQMRERMLPAVHESALPAVMRRGYVTWQRRYRCQDRTSHVEGATQSRSPTLFPEGET
eukprot:2985152-Rhodomonas_salina.2